MDFSDRLLDHPAARSRRNLDKPSVKRYTLAVVVYYPVRPRGTLRRRQSQHTREEDIVIKKFFEVNIAVKDLDAAMKTYRAITGVEAKETPASEFAFPGLRGAT